MSAVIGFVMAEKELRVLPKFGMSLEEVNFAYGTEDLVRSLRQIGALMPAKKHGRTLVFDVGDVAEVWARYMKGEYDARIRELGK